MFEMAFEKVGLRNMVHGEKRTFFFNPLKLEESHEIVVENYFDIRNWEEYTDFIAASRNFSMRKPSKSILIRGGFNPIASDDQET